MTLHTTHIAGTDAPAPPRLRHAPRGAWAEARDAEAIETGTRSPVALFQVRELVPPQDGWPSEGDCSNTYRKGQRVLTEIVFTEDGWCWVGTADALTVDELLTSGLARETWRTECVCLNWADGERYGVRHGHDYRDGWRVHPVPTEYDLEELLTEGASWRGFS